MDIMNLIKNRRSIRKYTDQPVEKAQIDQIIEAGLWAPSGHNGQPWHFTVIKNDDLGRNINEATKKILLKSDVEWMQRIAKRDDLFYGAPIIIVVSGLKDSRIAIVDCSAATQNMLLMAESLGLGTCWNGLVISLFEEKPDHPSVKALEIPEDYEPLYAVSLGYYENKQDAPKRKGTPVNFIGF